MSICGHFPNTRFAKGRKTACNAKMRHSQIKEFCELDPTAQEMLRNAMEQLQTTAEELKAQAQVYESQRSRIRLACIFSVLALLMSGAALIIALCGK